MVLGKQAAARLARPVLWPTNTRSTAETCICTSAVGSSFGPAIRGMTWWGRCLFPAWVARHRLFERCCSRSWEVDTRSGVRLCGAMVAVFFPARLAVLVACWGLFPVMRCAFWSPRGALIRCSLGSCIAVAVWRMYAHWTLAASIRRLRSLSEGFFVPESRPLTGREAGMPKEFETFPFGGSRLVGLWLVKLVQARVSRAEALHAAARRRPGRGVFSRSQAGITSHHRAVVASIALGAPSP